MNNEPLNITDPNIRIPTPETDEQMRKFEKYKMDLATQHENELLNRRCLVDVFMDAADKIKTIFAHREKTK